MKIILSKNFKMEIKNLKRKYKHINQDLKNLLELIKSNPDIGISIGGGFRKIRLKNSDISKGKSSGYRVITCYISQDKKLFLVDIYTHKQKDNVSVEEMIKLLNEEGILYNK